jgi:excisionase family DNA binding protein
MAELLTVNEVSERLRVTPLTIRRWLKSGDLVGIQLGDRAGWRISEDDLNNFLRRRRSDTDAEGVEMGKAAA